jgi:DNA polymerase-3 subunit delta'
VRVPLVPDAAVRAFVENPEVKKVLDKDGKAGTAERVRAAAGAPGRLLTGKIDAKATVNARRIIDAATNVRRAAAYSTALSQGAAGARGGFTDTLDALVELLGERARDALHREDQPSAASASRAVDAVLRAQTHADGNVSPQIIAAKLIRELASTLK